MLTRQQIMTFIQGHEQGVLATVTADLPEAELVTIAVTGDLEILFNATRGSRQCLSLERNNSVVLVVGWHNGTTMQLGGKVHQASGAEVPVLQEIYFARFPEARGRPCPDTVYFVLRPNWVRYKNCTSPEPRILEAHLA